MTTFSLLAALHAVLMRGGYSAGHGSGGGKVFLVLVLLMVLMAAIGSR